MPSPDSFFKEALGLSSSRKVAAPVFSGDQRKRVLSLVSTALREGRQAAVLGAIQKDPSLLLEEIPDPENQKGQQIPFALACLREGVQSGYMLAIAHGFNIDTPSAKDPRYGALLYDAVIHGRTQDVFLLIGYGATVANLDVPRDVLKHIQSGPGRDSLLQMAIGQWTGIQAAGKNPEPPKVVFALLDAGLGAEVGEYAVNSLIRSGDWNNTSYRHYATQITGRLVKAGLTFDGDWNRPTHPMLAALGAKNGFAVELLVAMGCVGESSADLFDRMKGNGLVEHIPGVQAQLMKRSISSVRSDAADIASSINPSVPAPGGRRRAAAL